VRVLEAASYEAGEHAVAWDGRDDAGRNAPSGVYLVQLRGDGFAETAAATLVR
jgi:flagellar hook assembly protein FlgD